MENENKKQVRNAAVLIAVMSLALGTIAGFLAPGNMFQAAVIVIVALIFIAFFAMQMIEKKEVESKQNKSLTQYYKKLKKQNGR
jgi:quinol-cytochrome oxidoreductase complex cytochrome b subunit